MRIFLGIGVVFLLWWLPFLMAYYLLRAAYFAVRALGDLIRLGSILLAGGQDENIEQDH